MYKIYLIPIFSLMTNFLLATAIPIENLRDDTPGTIRLIHSGNFKKFDALNHDEPFRLLTDHNFQQREKNGDEGLKRLDSVFLDKQDNPEEFFQTIFEVLNQKNRINTLIFGVFYDNADGEKVLASAAKIVLKPTNYNAPLCEIMFKTALDCRGKGWGATLVNSIIDNSLLYFPNTLICAEINLNNAKSLSTILRMDYTSCYYIDDHRAQKEELIILFGQYQEELSNLFSRNDPNNFFETPVTSCLDIESFGDEKKILTTKQNLEHQDWIAQRQLEDEETRKLQKIESLILKAKKSKSNFQKKYILQDLKNLLTPKEIQSRLKQDPFELDLQNELNITEKLHKKKVRLTIREMFSPSNEKNKILNPLLDPDAFFEKKLSYLQEKKNLIELVGLDEVTIIQLSQDFSKRITTLTEKYRKLSDFSKPVLKKKIDICTEIASFYGLQLTESGDMV